MYSLNLIIFTRLFLKKESIFRLQFSTTHISCLSFGNSMLHCWKNITIKKLFPSFKHGIRWLIRFNEYIYIYKKKLMELVMKFKIFHLLWSNETQKINNSKQDLSILIFTSVCFGIWMQSSVIIIKYDVVFIKNKNSKQNQFIFLLKIR